MGRPPNLILITVDCLGYKYLEEARKTLNYFKSNGTVFENAFSVAPWTPPSFKAMFQSIYPSSFGGYMKLSNEMPSFVEVLKQNGYYTMGISQTPWLSKFFGYHRGFDRFENFDIHNSFYLKMMKKIYYGLVNRQPKLWALYYILANQFGESADLTVNKTVDGYFRGYQKEIGDKPIFLWVHYMGLHDPSVPSKNYNSFKTSEIMRLLEKYKRYMNNQNVDVKDLLNSEDLDKFKKLYEASIREIDDTIMDLIKKLDNYVSFDNTVVMLTADHGQEFGEHGMFSHGVHLYDELIKVPLLIKGCETGNNANKVESLVSLIDLPPTILEISDSKIPLLYQGKSFNHLIKGVSSKHRSYVVSEEGKDQILVPFVNYRFDRDRIKLAIRTENWKYIYNLPSSKEELYHLSSDSEEKSNLLDGFEDVKLKFREVRDKHIKKTSGLE